MKKVFHLAIVTFIICSIVLPIFQVQSWNLNQDNPTKLVEEIYRQSNKSKSTRVQYTDLDESITSKGAACD